jgi:RsiW-degrading membrane proteinase PrsW (M82 family)
VRIGLLIVAATAPSLFLLTFFYLKDRYEHEPLLQVLMAFGLVRRAPCASPFRPAGQA